MLLTGTREEAVKTAASVRTVETVETAKVGKDDEESEGKYPNLARVPCIWYPITFQKNSMSVLAFFNSGSEVNTIYPTLALELGLLIRPTDIGAQKINGIMLDIYEMVVTVFSVMDKTNWVRFFEETFLMANISPKIVLGLSLLTLSGADVNFLGQELRWKTYTNKETLPTIRRVKLVDKKEFAAAALNPEHETYIFYVGLVSSDALPSSSPLDLYSSRRPQISGLIAEEAPMKVSAKYSDFADSFSPDLAFELPKYTGINNHAINLVKSCQQPPYRPIYNLGQ